MMKINKIFLLAMFASSVCFADKVTLEKDHVGALIEAIINAHEVYEGKLLDSNKIDGMILLPYMSSVSLLLSHRYMADPVADISDEDVCKMGVSIKKIKERFYEDLSVYSDVERVSFPPAFESASSMVENLNVDCREAVNVSEVNRKKITEWKKTRKEKSE